VILASVEFADLANPGKSLLAVVVGLSRRELDGLRDGVETYGADLARVAGGRWPDLAGRVRIVGTTSAAQEAATLTSAVVTRGLSLTLCVIVPYVARILHGEVLVVSQPERLAVRKLAICRASRIEELAAAAIVAALPGGKIVAVWLGEDGGEAVELVGG